MKILYLYSEVMGYNIPVFEKLANKFKVSVHVVHWNKNKLTPFNPEPISGVQYYERSSFTKKSLIDFVVELNPNLVYISGWMDKDYLSATQRLKSIGVPVVVGLDSQWTGTLRQYIGAQIIRHFYKKRYFNFALVPGPMQYEYAARVGFKKNEILCNLLSANTEIFNYSAATSNQSKTKKYPEKFIYVGRFVQAKGIDLLIEAYDIYRNEFGGQWSLSCIGNGPMKDVLLNHPQIVIEDFLPQQALSDRAKTAGAFILPSRSEPWGVVVHEFAAAGLPMILSENVGARPQFLIDGLNGYTFHNNSARELAEKMYRISSSVTADLIKMGENSIMLANKINPEIAAASLISVINSKIEIK